VTQATNPLEQLRVPSDAHALDLIRGVATWFTDGDQEHPGAATLNVHGVLPTTADRLADQAREYGLTVTDDIRWKVTGVDAGDRPLVTGHREVVIRPAGESYYGVTLFVTGEVTQ